MRLIDADELTEYIQRMKETGNSEDMNNSQIYTGMRDKKCVRI
jgi:hypothetical protein